MTPDRLAALLEETFPLSDSWDGHEAPGFRYGYQGSYGGSKGDGVDEFYHSLAQSSSSIFVEGLGTFTKVEYLTPFDEAGDIEAVLVFKFKPEVAEPQLFDIDDEKTYRITGYLDSWEGGPWNGRLQEVRPVEKTITIWETL